MTIPKPKVNKSDLPTEFHKLYDMALKLTNNIDQNGFDDPWRKTYIFEEVMIAIYGEDYFEWYNKKRIR